MIKYVRAERSDYETWEKIYRFDLALLSRNSNYGKYLEGNPEWRVIKRCAQRCFIRSAIREIGES